MSYQRYSTTEDTTDATPTVVWSTPVSEGTSVRVDVDFQVITDTLSNGACGTIYALFTRASGGNVTRATGNGGLLGATLAIVGNFVSNPGIELVANTANQTVDLKVTGLALTNLAWKYSPNVRRN